MSAPEPIVVAGVDGQVDGCEVSVFSMPADFLNDDEGAPPYRRFSISVRGEKVRLVSDQGGGAIELVFSELSLLIEALQSLDQTESEYETLVLDPSL